MPFASEAQRRFLYARHPEVAKRWQKHTPKGTKLPEHVKAAADLGFGLGYKAFALALVVKEAAGVQRILRLAKANPSAESGLLQSGMEQRSLAAKSPQQARLRALGMLEELRRRAAFNRPGAGAKTAAHDKIMAAAHRDKTAAFKVRGPMALLGKLGIGTQRLARAGGKPFGVDPLAWMRTGDSALTNARRAQLLGAVTAAAGGYGAYKMMQPSEESRRLPVYTPYRVSPYYPAPGR